MVTMHVVLALLALASVACISAVTPEVIVCVYFYVWYSSDGRHWGAPGDPQWSVLDVPVLGYYDSRDVEVIRWQLGLIREAGIDCLFISWWGPGSFEDMAAQRVFGALREYGLRAAILIEPYRGGDPNLYDRAWWDRVLAYIKENYVDRYPGVYLYLDGKPLILAFNPIGMKYNPSQDYPGYAIRIVGNDIDNAGYQDWDLWPDYDASLTGELRVRRDGYVALAPRFDDEHFRPGGVPAYDPDLSRRWYEKQWEWVLGNLDRVRIVAIYSWNEYHERSAIEPHNDATAANKDPFYLYNVTKQYIKKLRTLLGVPTDKMIWVLRHLHCPL